MKSYNILVNKFGGIMAKSLFEFANEKKIDSEKNLDSVKTSRINKKIDEEKIKETFNKYSNYSSSELINELNKQVNKQKKEGTFNFSEIADRIQGIRPMLSEEQIKNLDRLLNQIK